MRRSRSRSRRRRRHPTFSSPAAGPGGVRWLQPVQRRRRRRLPVAPIVVLAALVALAAGAFMVVRARDDGEDPSRAVAQRFADAWARGDLDTAWRLTTGETREAQPLSLFEDSYRAGDARRVGHGDPRRPGR